MALVTAPLMSFDASGTIAKSAVFAKWRGRNYVRRHAIPSNPRTDAQCKIRAWFHFLSQTWITLSTQQKESWTDLAAATNISRFNAFIANAYDRMKIGKNPIAQYGSEATTTINEVTSPTGDLYGDILVCSWTLPVANLPDWYHFLCVSHSDPQLQLNQIRIVVPYTVLAVEVHNVPANYQYIRIWSGSKNGSRTSAGTLLDLT
jgi:hypothetical protein